MKKKNFLWSLLILLMSVTMCVGFTSCSDDDDDSTPAVTIRNSSSYPMNSFTVFFINDNGENVAIRQFGTVIPNQVITAEIPTGATMYWIGAYVSSIQIISSNYKISDRRLEITDININTWAQ